METLYLGVVSALWRYPVSGLQGESLRAGTVTTQGLRGDHSFVLRVKTTNKVLGPKSGSHSSDNIESAPGILEFRASFLGNSTGVDSLAVQFSSGHTINSASPSFESELSDALGASVELVPYPRIAETRVRAGRTLHLLTSASLDRMKTFYPAGDFRPLRFRPNILVQPPSGLAGFVEEGWVGRTVEVGREVKLLVNKPNTRCKVTTMKQGDAPEDELILRAIENQNGNRLGVMCSVQSEGEVRVGDPLRLAA